MDWRKLIVSTHPPRTGHVSSIIDVKMIIAVHLQTIKLQQELLDDRLGLEGDDAVLVPLVLAVEDHPVHRPGDAGHEVTLPRLAADLPN